MNLSTPYIAPNQLQINGVRNVDNTQTNSSLNDTNTDVVGAPKDQGGTGI